MDQLSEPTSRDVVLQLMNLIEQRIINEDRLKSERTSLFAVSNSFLVTGYIVALTLRYGIKIPMVLAGLGILLSLLQLMLMIFNLKILERWYEIRNRLDNQPSVASLLSQKLLDMPYGSNLCSRIKRLGLDPNTIAKFWIPLSFLVMWILLIIFSLPNGQTFGR